MRIRAITAALAMLAGFSAHAAEAALVTDQIPPVPSQARMAPAAGDLPLGLSMQDLVPTAGGVAYLALDHYKVQAEHDGLVYAAMDAGAKTDAQLNAAVAQVGAEGIAKDMNTRFYGSLLVFAAGCMMWLAISVRRNP